MLFCTYFNSWYKWLMTLPSTKWSSQRCWKPHQIMVVFGWYHRCFRSLLFGDMDESSSMLAVFAFSRCRWKMFCFRVSEVVVAWISVRGRRCYSEDSMEIHTLSSVVRCITVCGVHSFKVMLPLRRGSRELLVHFDVEEPAFPKWIFTAPQLFRFVLSITPPHISAAVRDHVAGL